MESFIIKKTKNIICLQRSTFININIIIILLKVFKTPIPAQIKTLINLYDLKSNKSPNCIM